MRSIFRKLVVPSLSCLVALLTPDAAARAFCGFYVAKADTRLFNRASQVVLARDGDRTVITMASDYRGDPSEFAVVIPVPTFIERGQIHVADPALVEHLDAYTAPRLVEYHDPDPCMVERRMEREAVADAQMAAGIPGERAKALGVSVEASYTVGEYDILVLSATESSGLETWLRESGYRIPDGASAVLSGYMKQGMRFFVARVNLEEQARLGYASLRPIQVAYETPKFVLPIRLGTVNADGPQELFVYALTPTGRVETTNYRTVRLPTGMDLPVYVRSEFDDFYRAMFTEQVEKERGRAVFLEYAWDMAWCDPCAADPLRRDELRGLGVHWLGADADGTRGPVPGAGARNVFVTRLHVRYDGTTFPEDLVFQETGDRTNFQGRYVLRHAWNGGASCAQADRYRRELGARHEREASTLAALTGWDIADIRRRMGVETTSSGAGGRSPWWKDLWPDR